MTKPRATYLTVPEMFRLEHQCRLLSATFGFHTYLVGSVLERADYRDVDLRCILDDGEFVAMGFANEYRLHFMNACVTEWIAARTGLNIDFQFQQRTAANTEYPGQRSFMGIPLDPSRAQEQQETN
jgi:hypothetical protein